MIDLHRVVSREGFQRTLRVYAPTSARRLPVIYLHDGQNVFDADAEVSPSWGVDVALDAWIASGGAPFIAVGIDHRGVERIGDDSPWPDATSDARPRGTAYAAFVADEATAFVDARYPTIASPDARVIAGSSLGGLMALYLGARHPQSFRRIAAFSPTTMWGGDALFGVWNETTPRPLRLYLDVGAKERFESGDTVLDYGGEVPRFAEHLRALGYGDALRLVVDEAGEHCEADWRRRFVDALPFLLG